MKSTGNPKTIKANGAIQRQDITLTEEVASALVRKVFLGETLFPKEGYIVLSVEGENGEEALINLSCNTLNAWVTRGNALPNGNAIRTILDKAREDYRIRKREELKDRLVADAERELTRTLNVRSNVPVRDRLGQTMTDPATGGLIRREDANLLRIKVDTAKYVTERLDPERYGRKSHTTSKTLTFSLADLREYKKVRDAQRAQ